MMTADDYRQLNEDIIAGLYGMEHPTHPRAVPLTPEHKQALAAHKGWGRAPSHAGNHPPPARRRSGLKRNVFARHSSAGAPGVRPKRRAPTSGETHE